VRDRRCRGEGNDYRWLRIGEERGKQEIMGWDRITGEDKAGRGKKKEKKSKKRVHPAQDALTPKASPRFTK
jgi:hypothetical protein